jgi:hypothetical protein
MASHTKTQPNSGFNRRLFLAGAAGGAMLPIAAARAAPKKRGIFADSGLTDKVADFSYQNDVLAQLIVELWSGAYPGLIATATTPAQYQARSFAAKGVLEDRGIYLTVPIVITEKEYEDGFSLQDAGLAPDTGIVFVLPRPSRATTGGPPLLETAKMLMAITPNGI